jgi:putative drug exporter of the RND superfamily
LFALLGRFAYRHRWWVIAGWLVVLVAGGLFGSSVFDRVEDDQGSHTESAEVERQLAEFGGVDADVWILLDGMAVRDPELRSSVAALTRDLRAMPDVRAVTGPGSAGPDGSPDAGPSPEPGPETGMVAKDGRALLLAVELRRDIEPSDTKPVVDEITARVQDVDVPRALVGGPAPLLTELQTSSQQQLARGELIALPFIIALLVLAFRGVLPALLPLLVAAVSVVGALLVLLGVSYATAVSPYAVNVISMVGLGLAVDYALLLVSRFREERAAGRVEIEEAVTRMAATAGRTVTFSAVTVIVALTGLLVFDEPMLWSIALGAIGVVSMTVAAALTLVPAFLRLFGPRIKPAPAGGDHGVFYRLARVTQRFALVLAPLLVAGLVVLAAPIGHAEWGRSGPESLPSSSPTRQLAQVVQERFPVGGSTPITVVANIVPGSPTATSLINWLEGRPGVTAVRVRPQAPANTTVLEVLPSGPDQEITAKQIVRDIHGLDLATQVHVLAGGPTAGVVDFEDLVGQRLGWAISVLALATLALIFLMTRSVVVAVKAIVMNVLSLGASFGALVWIFQDGHLSGLLGFDPVGSIDGSLYIVIFVLAFGLSMDYEVFLLSRIKEHYDRTGDTDEAVAIGLQRSGRIVTMAAALMVVVFLGFAAGDVLAVKEFGLGLALIILIDATIVRTLLVPAVMKLMGRWNWWAPGTRRATPGPMVPASTIEMPRWPTESDTMAISREGKDR